MIFNLVYYCDESMAAEVVTALRHLSARIKKRSHLHYRIEHLKLPGHEIDVDICLRASEMFFRLEHSNIDLVIIDERGLYPRSNAFELIRYFRSKPERTLFKDAFPLSKFVAILDKKHIDRTIDLGLEPHVSILVDPRSTSQIVLWLRKILNQKLKLKPKVGMSLSGGGLEGFLFQLGTIIALEKVFGSLDSFEVVGGISSGAIVGSIVAAGLSPQEVFLSLQKQSTRYPSLTSNMIFDLSMTDVFGRLVKFSMQKPTLRVQTFLQRLLELVPDGLFEGEKISRYIRKLMEIEGVEDHFGSMKKEFFIGATDQDLFKHTVLGLPPWDEVSVVDSIRASMALPPIFKSKKIIDHHFIDGQVTRTIDIGLLVDRGCSLIFIINPLKPFSSETKGFTQDKGGIYSLLQTIKALVSSRFEENMRHLTERYRTCDFILFEPENDLAKLMAGSPMRYRIRTKITQLAYEQTIHMFLDSYDLYRSTCEKHGMTILERDVIQSFLGEPKSVS